jgi:SNF2 family DNA or RNA helicase
MLKVGTKELYPHQVRGVAWMLEREEDTDLSGGFLCDTMGMGKTWTALGLIQESDLRRTLLLCPLAVVDQWVKAGCEAGFNVWTYACGGKWSAANDYVCGRKRLCVANYERIRENESERIYFDRIILDEAHILRAGSGKRYDTIYKLAKRIPTTWCLTGTPLVNDYKDVQSLYQILRGNRVDGTISNYASALCVASAYGLHRSVLTLPAEEVAVLNFGSAPRIQECVLPFSTETEAEFYRMIQGQIQRQLQVHEMMDVNNNMEMMKLLLRLRQISIHPQVYIEGIRRKYGGLYGRRNWVDADGNYMSSTKVDGLLCLLKSQTRSHNWVVFCNFQDEIKILESILSREKCVGQIHTYSGKQKMAARRDILEENMEVCEANMDVPWSITRRLPLPDDVCRIIQSFVNPRQNVFLVQIQAGGTGLNLQHNDRVVFMGPWWTAALMNQAVARVYRMGQRKEVQVYRMVLQEEQSLNIDRFMLNKVLAKESLCTDLLNACAEGVN